MNDTGARLYQGRAAQASAITVTVLYFARLREVLGSASETVVLPAGLQTLTGLRTHLRSRGGAWEAELAAEKPVRVAVNQDVAQADTALADGDEVAFFPPVTGG